MSQPDSPTRLERAVLVASIVMLLTLFGVNCYRAATQTLAHDEALAYNNFLTGRWTWPLTRYNSGNHVLHTFSQGMSIRAFGVSEFSLRLPSLLAGAAYFAAALILVRRVAGRGWLGLLTLGLMTLNPFLLDYLSASRGYSMALAALCWALVLMTWPGVPSLKRLAAISLLMGVSLAANLAFLLVLVPAATIYFATLLMERRPFWMTVACFALPGPAFAAMVLIMPLQGAAAGHFYVGQATLPEMIHYMLRVSLWHTYVASVPAWVQVAIALLAFVMLPLLVIGTGAALINIARKRRGSFFSSDEPETLGLWLVGGTLLATITLLVLVHHAVGMVFPEPRTGVYLFVLTALCAGGLIRSLLIQRVIRAGTGNYRLRVTAAMATALILLAVNIRFAWQFNTRYYLTWFYDAQLTEVLDTLDADRREQGLGEVRLGGHFVFEPTVNFYRTHEQLDWLAPYERGSDEHPEAHDYMLFSTWSETSPGELGMTVLHEDAYGTVLARCPREGQVTMRGTE